MKKFILIFIFLFSLTPVYAADLIDVDLVRCVDGDTAVFKVAGEEIKFRFLAVDTPETVHPTKGEEEGGKDASTFTCNSLTNAHKIQIEYDAKSGKTDKYGRGLAWIYIDGELFQRTLVSKGYAEVAYIYAKYSYVDELCEVQREAIDKKIGIWSGDRKEGYCKTKSNTNSTTSTTKKTNKTTKRAKDKDILEILEEEMEKTTYVPLLVILILAYGVIKYMRGKKKKK